MEKLSSYKGNMTEKTFQNHLDFLFSLYTLNKVVHDPNSYLDDFFLIAQKYYKDVVRYAPILQEDANNKIAVRSIRQKLALDSETIALLLCEDACQPEVYSHASYRIWYRIRPTLFEMLEEVDQKYRSKTAELARKLFD